MTITPGWFPTNYFPTGYWSNDFWPEYGRYAFYDHDHYEPIILLQIFGDSTYRVATRDFMDPTYLFFKGDIIEDPTLYQEMDDVFWGHAHTREITFQIRDIDTGVDTDETWVEIAAGEELRGVGAAVRKFDPTDGTVFTFYGSVVSYSFYPGMFEVTIEVNDNKALEEPLPHGVVDTDTFHESALDVGAVINLCFGQCLGVPLRNIRNTAAAYDYLIGYGTIESLWTASGLGVKRDGRLVNAAEYTFYDGSQGSPYPGYAFLRFVVEQRNFSGGYHNLTADVKGLELGGATAERNFANVIKYVLNDSTIGLNLSVDAASFTTAAAALDTITNLYCDGALVKQISALDLLDKLLYPARSFLVRASDGEWEMSVDTAGSSIETFEDGVDCEVISVSCTPAHEAVKNTDVHYAYNAASGSPTYVNTVAVHSTFGEDRIYELPFVYEHDTAVKVLSYSKNRSIYSDALATIKASLRGRLLKVNDIITLTASLYGISSQEYKIVSSQKSLTDFIYHLRAYSASIYGDEGIGSPTAWVGNTVVLSHAQSIGGAIYLGDGSQQSGNIIFYHAPTKGDTTIRAGKTDFTNAQAGFILGIDDSDSDLAKFYIGNANSFWNWRGTYSVMQIGSKGGFSIVDIADPSAFSIGTEMMELVQEDADCRYQATVYSDTGGDAPTVYLRKSKGSYETPTIVADDDYIGAMTFWAYDGAAFIPAGSIACLVDGTPGRNDMPTRILIANVADGAATLSTRICLLQDGKIGFGTIYPKSRLDVEGNVAIGATHSGSNAAPANGLLIEGKVGIGSSASASVEAPLHIVDTGGTNQIIISDSIGATEKRGVIELSYASTYFMVQGVHQGIGFWDFLLNPDGANVGVGTYNPGQLFDVNQGGGNMIADGYDAHSLARYKEDLSDMIEDVIDKFKAVKLKKWKRKPHVSAEELKDLAIGEFGKERWEQTYPGRTDHRSGALWDCPDQEMKGFIDQEADRLREERRLLPIWRQGHIGLVADDPSLDAMPDLRSINEQGNIRGVSLNNHIGLLHGVLKNAIERIEAIEARVN